MSAGFFLIMLGLELMSDEFAFLTALIGGTVLLIGTGLMMKVAFDN